jgi:hypothetical protein
MVLIIEFLLTHLLSLVIHCVSPLLHLAVFCIGLAALERDDTNWQSVTAGKCASVCLRRTKLPSASHWITVLWSEGQKIGYLDILRNYFDYCSNDLPKSKI